ncbi:MAG TPA: roadblock/LC7 domain-containing protein [Gemmatimonadales bacterium]|jgi:predicted regulator of Ras-like GTPase activity (Roadblock/LC7/MglB family)|nr:roadblock/LC7 domain-containing protein [Gemmatimonadales bacterium]
MPSLAELVNDLAARPSVTAVVVASPDGLPISSAGSSLDAEALAALTVTIARSSARLGDTARIGAAARYVVECGAGLALGGIIRDGNWLLVLTEPSADVGQLLFELRQEGPLLAAQL